ncbi:hypothetical protein [Mucilaginibacter sp. AK015]|uniref:hypothetical protein n=1 Tax=Mucilaginibacter sp. AK015 TaxID=2723072 RepID=UPI00160AC412|nr:hypothetical protein [Mucilaginibacter sp. AK015]MBB5395593.1 hypothetical protein [Mucilaginibacter sp. AK015]
MNVSPLIAADGYFFCLDTKEAKDQVRVMLPPALPVLNAFFLDCSLRSNPSKKAKPSFPPAPGPLTLTGSPTLLKVETDERNVSQKCGIGLFG